MTEQTAGWIAEPNELPAGQALRSVATILADHPTSRAERDQERWERAREDARQARVQDVADTMEAAAFRASLRGETPRTAGDVLTEAGREPLGRQDAGRRRAAIEILRQHGLADVIDGGGSGVVIDANMGVLEPFVDERARAAMDQQYEFERAERKAEEGTRAVAAARARLDEQWRARGLGPLRPSHQPAVRGETAEEARYRRACEEIGQYGGVRYR
jgi:hypothetical protein